ncbi:MAG TPA: hypothetical protein VMD04_01935, partial [Candidatus Margulisiibacteriota bacterium]|nr:hypothetical protein [Candidatus Margulisiibacteriota bacterium]
YFPRSHYIWGYEFKTLIDNLEEKGNYRYGADYSSWLSNLDKRLADYLFIYSIHQIKNIIFPVEDLWALAHPDKFKLVFCNKTVRIYRIVK